jgi:hypothetical protein
MIGKFAIMLMTACALAALAGGAQSNSSAEMSAAAPPPPAAAPPPAQSAAPAPPPPPAKQAALTPEEAKGQCWMKYENDRRAKSIDDRLKLVEKCVDDTLRNQPPQR